MKNRLSHSISILLVLCFSCVAFALNAQVVRLGEEILGTSARSVEQVLDDGRVAVIFTPVEKADESYRGAYLVDDDEVTLISAYENVPNIFGWPWAAQTLVGLSDGSQFWCVSEDQLGGNLFNTRVHYYGSVGLKATQSNGTQRIYLSEEGGALLYCGTVASKLGSFEQQVFTQEGEAFTLDKNTGINPAVTSDFQSLFYLAVNGANTRLTLRKYDLQTGEVADLEDVGEREVLGLFNGGFLKEQHAVSSSSDGSVVAYRFAETNVPMLRVALRDSYGVYSFETLDDTSEATSPAISANGQFVAYRKDGQIFRYDLSNGTTEAVSLEGQDNSSSQPMISPNGRYISYVDNGGALWRADCGASIAVAESTQYFATDSEDELGVVVNGASEDTMIAWEPVDEAVELPGMFVTNEGAEVQRGEMYPVSSLPWRFQAQAGSPCQIRLSLNTGYSSTLTLVISDFKNLTASVVKDYACRYNALQFLDSSTMGMVTNVMGDSVSDMEFWSYGVKDMSWQNLPIGGVPKQAVASQDGSLVYWVDAQGVLYRNATKILDGEVTEVAVSQDGHVSVIQEGALKFSEDQGTSFAAIAGNSCHDVRISADGATMAWIEGTSLMVRYRFGAESLRYAQNVSRLYGMSQDGLQLLYQSTDGVYHGAKSTSNSASAIFDLTAIPANAQNVVFSANGRRVMYTAVSEGVGAKASLYTMDVDVLGKRAGSVSCLTAEPCRDVLQVAVSPSAQYSVVSSAADLEKGGTTIAENQSVNLFQWTDSQWTNKSPYFGVTSLGEVNEDEEKEFSLYMKDDDDNALVPKILVESVHGTVKMMTPIKGKPSYKLYYTPEPDYNGTDQVTLSLTDGSVVIARTLTIAVNPINDPPVWDDEQTPASIAMNALEIKAVTLVATDVDTAPDGLAYSLKEGAPAWACVQGNQLVLTPGLKDSGEVVLTAQVSDGEFTVPKDITVTVSVGEVEIPVEVMLDASAAPVNPETYDEHLQVTVAGCWEGLANGGWYPLSLPGTADIAQLCAALGCGEIYIYQGEYLAISTGTLPAGTGFWAKPDWDASAVIALTPAESPTETERFIGYTWGEEEPEDGMELFKVQDGVFQKTSEWKIGRGYFR